MGSNVLIVEDEALVALELRENVERLGHDVIGITDSAEQAVSLAIKKKPNLIIMDVRLSGRMDGIEAAELIRNSADIPILFLTAYSGDETLSRATDAEPYGYLLKPVQERQLAGAIEIAMQRHKKDAKLRESYKNALTILRALPHAVVVTGNSLEVRYLNSSAEILLGIKMRDVVGKPLSEVVSVAETRLNLTSSVGFDEVMNDGRSVILGEYTLIRKSQDPHPIRIELSPLLERNSVTSGVLVSLLEAQDDPDSIGVDRKELSELGDMDPIIKEKGDLRSYLEVEIVRLSMNGPGPGSGPEAKPYCEGQVAACKQVLRFMFGEGALADIEAILPATGDR